MKITKKNIQSPYGVIEIWRLENATGAYVELSSLGAGILAVGVPDKNGNIENVALGYMNPADYMNDGPCMGKVPGRYANRIARGRFSIDGTEYHLAINNGPNALHGGPTGFQNRIWQARQTSDNSVEFTCFSKDGEEGYPGNMTVSALYTWDDDNTLSLTLKAVSDKDTIVNLTNHAYWNLRGADSGSVLEHTLQINASRWLPTDETLIPTGELAMVTDTPMDFRIPKKLGEEIHADFPALKFGKGYDNCWVIDNSGSETVRAATLKDEISGRALQIFTDQPGVQVYTGNWLAGAPLDRSGREYKDYDGVAIEAQGFPDAPNHPSFPSQLLKKDDIYCRNIIFRFTC